MNPSKQILPAHVRAMEREREVERLRVVSLCANLAAQMTEAGWTDIKAQPKATFIAISGNDPAGANHSAAMEDGQSLADFLISIGIKPARKPSPEAERIEAPSLSAGPDRVEQNDYPDGFKDDDDLSELKSLQASLDERSEELAVAKERIAELTERLEAAEGPGLLPDLATKMSDYVPNEIRDLMEPGETFAQARKRLSELLNVEKAELRLKRAAGSATEAELKREADVDRLQGLFSKLGEI